MSDSIVIEESNGEVTVIEPTVVINQTTCAAEWGGITGDIADQDDLMAELAKKMDVAPTILPIDTNYDSIVTNGTYQVDHNIITVKVAENYINGAIVNQVMTSDDGTMQYRQHQNGVWSTWKEFAWWNYTLEELALKENITPTVLASGTNPNDVKTNGKYAIDNTLLCVYNAGTVTYQTHFTDEYTMMFRMGESPFWSSWNQIARAEQVSADLESKVDKVTGKGLSTNDYTNEDKNKLSAAVTSSTIATIVTLTQTAYDALNPKVATTLYIITGA